MVLIYSRQSARLNYIASFVFTEHLGLPFSFTEDRSFFESSNEIRIHYGDHYFPGTFNIPSKGLLFERGINQPNAVCFDTTHFKAIFKAPGGDIEFDIFSAIFYMITRYEEYLPHEKDEYGRYDHECSMAFKESFLHLPLVNIWIQDFAEKLKEKFSIGIQLPPFRFTPTYDIDIAYSYLHKGIIRNLGGFIRSPSLERLKVLFGGNTDPFDSYHFMDELHQENKFAPMYFFLVAANRGKYDKNLPPDQPAISKLIKEHGAKYKLGIHPSWGSDSDPAKIRKEINTLEKICGQKITSSRQHYIRLTIPRTYRSLAEAGITSDYSMGYGSINGFRASAASSFLWYDIEKELVTNLRIYPFCYMDANSYFEQKLNAEEGYEELMEYYNTCRKYQGHLITIFHNNFLGSDEKFKGWKEMYRKFTSRVQQ